MPAYGLAEGPLRPIVDRTIFGIVQTHTFTPGNFALLSSGVCRINPRLAKAVVERIGCSAEAVKLALQMAKQLVG